MRALDACVSPSRDLPIEEEQCGGLRPPHCVPDLSSGRTGRGAPQCGLSSSVLGSAAVSRYAAAMRRPLAAEGRAGTAGAPSSSSWKNAIRSLMDCDCCASVLAVAAFSCPVFLIGYALVGQFARTWKLLPVQGYTPLSEGLVPFLLHLALPAVSNSSCADG